MSSASFNTPFRINCAARATLLMIFMGYSLPAQDSDVASLSPQPIMLIEQGYTPDGDATPAWRAALRHLRRFDVDFNESTLKRNPTTADQRWETLIRSRAAHWAGLADSLATPFPGVAGRDTIRVLIGNQGGEDAFVFADSVICFDLSRLQEIYGDADDPANRDRIDRFFAHEYTHILHEAWLKKNPQPIASPLEEALWICLKEGIGNYRSLSRKWVTEEGELTPHAERALSRLQSIFVERILALAGVVDEIEARRLMQGLSIGPFDQKWGALTVALWLARDIAGDDRKLRRWVEAGPRGILKLAAEQLPGDLAALLPQE